MLKKYLLIKNFLNSELGSDICWLYVIYFLNYLVPLLLIPYLARILGASGWGVLAFMLAFVSFISLFTEYGFYLSAQREVARCQGSREALSRLFNEVLSTKLLLAVFVAVIFSITTIFVPELNRDPRLFFGVLLLGITQAFSLTWYLRGVQKIKLATAMEVVAKILSAILIVLAIKTPTDFWKYFYAFGISQLIVLAWAFFYISRSIRILMPSFSVALRGLHSGGAIFVLHSIGSIFTVSNVLILGFLAPIQVVGYFAGAEKIVRFLAGMMDPIRHAMFPRLSNLAISNYQEARMQVRNVLIIMGVVSLAIGCLVFLYSPILVNIILGSDFLKSTDSLRIMSILVPVLTLNAGLGFLWMLPRGFERISVIIVLSALLVNIILAFLLVPIWQQIGMSISVIASELLIVILVLVVFLGDKGEKNDLRLTATKNHTSSKKSSA